MPNPLLLRPALSEGTPIDPITPEINLGDPPSVLDVVERVGVEDDKIGAHTRLDHSIPYGGISGKGRACLGDPELIDDIT